MLGAFSDKRYNYYRLTKSLGLYNFSYGSKQYLLPEGAIFVHDKNDKVKGSMGCLKLCWKPDGSTYGVISGGCMVFHAMFIDTDLFELVQSSEDVEIVKKLENLINDLENQLQNAKEQLKDIKESKFQV